MSRARDLADGALYKITPSTSGNVLTSDGNNWTSSANPTELPAHGSDGNILTSTGSAWASEANPLPAHSTVGNVLTSTGSAWASQAAAGGGAWEYLSTVGAAVSAYASDISFNQIFNSSYDVYMFVGTKIDPIDTNNKTLHFIFKTGSGNTAQTGNWVWQIDYGGSTSGNNTYNSIATGNYTNNEMFINYETQDCGTALNQNFIMYVIPNQNTLRASGGSAVADYPQVMTFGISTSDYNSGTVNRCHGIGMWRQTTAITGCKFMYDSGYIYGDVDAYGLKFS